MASYAKDLVKVGLELEQKEIFESQVRPAI
jgi:hypothetical protein